MHWGSSHSDGSQDAAEPHAHLSSVAEQPAAQPAPAENGHAEAAEAAQRHQDALESQVTTPFQTLSMARRTSSSLAKDSPVWRPGELGGPGGRLQTISMLPRGQVLGLSCSAVLIDNQCWAAEYPRFRELAQCPCMCCLSECMDACAGAADGDTFQEGSAACPTLDAKSSS